MPIPTKLNAYFDHVYVINLESRPERKLKMLQLFRKWNIEAEFIQAVNGYQSPHLEAYKAYQELPIGGGNAHRLELAYKKKMIKSPGAWGYLKTYEFLLKDAKKRNFNRILCLDDDVLFCRDFQGRFDELVTHIPEDWKLLYLGASQHVWKSPHGFRYPDPTVTEYDPTQPFYFPGATDGSFAVGIDQSVFDLLLKETLEMNCAFDSGPMRSVIRAYPEQCVVANPNIVIADVTSSDIQSDRDQMQAAQKLNWDLSLFDFPQELELISVIMPAFNAENSIEKAIRSILNQTYSKLEMIVADDGSTDRTAEIVEQLAKEDSRVKLVRLSENQGCYCARNAALRLSKGQLLAIQDADDIALSTRLEKQALPIFSGQAEFTLANISRSRCSVHELDFRDEEAMMALVNSRRIPKADGSYDFRDKFRPGFNTSVFKRSLFDEFGLFWEHSFGADMEFLERILYHRMGKSFAGKKYNAHTYLWREASIPGLYDHIDEVLLVSINMGPGNITNKAKEAQRKAYSLTYQRRLLGKGDYEYPKFEPHEKTSPSWKNLSFPALTPHFESPSYPEPEPETKIEAEPESEQTPVSKPSKKQLQNRSAPPPRPPQIGRKPLIFNLAKLDWMFLVIMGVVLLTGILGKVFLFEWIFDVSLSISLLMMFFGLVQIIRSQQIERSARDIQNSFEIKDEVREVKYLLKEWKQELDEE